MLPRHLLRCVSFITSLRTAIRMALRSSLEADSCLTSAPAKGELRPVAVERDVAGLGREADQRADARLDGGQAAADLGWSACPWRARGCAPADCRGRRRGTGCWSAPRAPSCAARGRAAPSRSRAPRRPSAFGIDGHEVVLARHLQAVAGVEEHADVCAPAARGELAHLAVEGGLVEVDAFDDLKAELPAAPRPRRSASFLGLASGAACW